MKRFTARKRARKPRWLKFKGNNKATYYVIHRMGHRNSCTWFNIHFKDFENIMYSFMNTSPFAISTNYIYSFNNASLEGNKVSLDCRSLSKRKTQKCCRKKNFFAERFHFKGRRDMMRLHQNLWFPLGESFFEKKAEKE